jgi:hypothetical protein
LSCRQTWNRLHREFLIGKSWNTKPLKFISVCGGRGAGGGLTLARHGYPHLVFNKNAMKQQKGDPYYIPPRPHPHKQNFLKNKSFLEFQLLCICIYQMNAAHPSKAWWFNDYVQSMFKSNKRPYSVIYMTYALKNVYLYKSFLHFQLFFKNLYNFN